ncbi:MAG: hypothetical protein GY822_26895 [Deltaproteobacteria bacterium]|nr:hypothetical protein [Deltaproteobacteria bacterium]
MIRHLTRIDGRFAIFFEEAILELLDIDEDTPLDVKTDGVRLLVKPISLAVNQRSGDLNSMNPSAFDPAVVAERSGEFACS